MTTYRWAPPAPPTPHTDPLSGVLAGGCEWVPVVHSTYGDGEPVEVRVVGGKVTYSAAMGAHFAVSVSVPRFAGGFDWCPKADPTHPLARYGQELSVAVRITSGTVEEVAQVATVGIHSWDLSEDGGTVEVTAYGPLKRAEEAGFTVPQSVRPGGTFASELTRLAAGTVPLVIDTALVDRAAPASLAWGDDRIKAFADLADAWPCRIRTDAYGTVWALPPLGEVPTPEARLSDGVGGTVVAAPVRDSREGIPNRVVARGESTSEDRPSVYGFAQIEDGPMSVHGPYGIVTHYYASPLLTTNAQCFTAAATRLANLTSQARTRTVVCAPDPRVRPDMALEVVYDGEATWGWVVGYELPLVVGQGSMRIDVEVPA